MLEQYSAQVTKRADRLGFDSAQNRHTNTLGGRCLPDNTDLTKS
jgi:hypothetical protein